MKTINILKIIVLTGFLLFLHDKSFKNNYFNYDGIAYVASAHMLQDNDIAASHAYAWSLLKERSHPSVFSDLCCKTSYRKSMFNSSDAFGSHLPSYRTKSLYVYSVRTVSDLFNIDEFAALKWISFICSVLMILVVASFFLKKNLMFYLSIFPIFFLMQIIPTTRLLTPDSLNALIMVSVGMSFLSKRKILAYSLLLGSILIRQTNIIFFGIFLVFELRAKNYVKFFSLSLLGLMLYEINSYYFESIGYWRSFQSSLIRMPDTFINFNPEFEISIFFSTLIAKVNWILGDANLNRLLSLMFLLLFICIYHFGNAKIEEKNDALVPLIFICCSILSFILIPFPDFRIYSGHLIAASITLLFSISNSKRMGQL
jgi:hypothetical protein